MAQDEPRVPTETLAHEAPILYIDAQMDSLRILSAATTLEAFTVDLLVRLCDCPAALVEENLRELTRRRRVFVRSSDTKGRTDATPTFAWTAGGAMVVRAEVEATLSARRSAVPIVNGERTERGALRDPGGPDVPDVSLHGPRNAIEPYVDAFESGLHMARNWVEHAEGSSDEDTLGRNLSMAEAEIRTLRRFLPGRPVSSVEQIEELTRRLDMLAFRAPVEAFRSRIRKSVLDALRDAGRHVPLETRTAEVDRSNADMAFVFNAIRGTHDTAEQVGRTVEQIGGSYVIFQMAQVPSRRRKRALEALGSFFTGPGSVKTKVFIIIDSGGDAKSNAVLRELAAFFGSSERLTGSIGRTNEGMNTYADWTYEPKLFLSTCATPADDWLPRGLLKHMLLQNYLGQSATTSESPDLARMALNDPVVFDCVSAGFVNGRPAKTRFVYHRVKMDFDHGAVIRGLVKGSFAGIGGETEGRSATGHVPLLTSRFS